MNKSDLVDYVAGKAGVPKTVADKVVGLVFDGVKAGLKKDGRVQVAGFGNFSVVQTKAREGRNPRTGAKLKIPAGKRPKFSAGKALKDAVGKK
ncbi:MAG: HU family DNA-binding protein [Pseudomonadota bacterium]|nr:HU family DNA-binding protein [Pseudomonadota bacterium]